jgi:TolB protein
MMTLATLGARYIGVIGNVGVLAYSGYRHGDADIIVMDTGRGATYRLVASRANDYDPAWSPDGRTLAFVSNRDGNPELYALNVYAGDLRRLTNHAAADYMPSWSPDGKQIAFVSERSTAPQLYVMDMESGAIRQITDHIASDYAPAWSPDGRGLFFTMFPLYGNPNNQRFGGDIYTMDLNTGKLNRVTFRDGSINFSPAFSPDGVRVIFGSNRADLNGSFNLFVMNLMENSRIDQLTRLTVSAYDADWSPQGDAIAFTAGAQPYLALFVMKADGSELTQLTAFTERASHPVWKP